MPSAQWAPFLAVVAALTVGILLLSRQSQSLLTEQAGDSTPPPAPTGPQPPGQQAPADGAPPTDVEVSPTRRQEPQLSTGMMFANVVFTQGLVAAVVVGTAWYFSIPADALGLSLLAGSRQAAMTGLGVGFGVCLWVANEFSTTVADAVGAAYDEGVRELLAPGTARGWTLLYLGVLPVIAVSEELLFRAALIGVPAAGYGVSPVVLGVVSSVTFALGHGAQGRVGVVVTGTLGLVLAAGYVVSGSLLLVVVAHYVINALEFLVHEHLGLAGPFESLVAEQNSTG